MFDHVILYQILFDPLDVWLTMDILFGPLDVWLTMDILITDIFEKLCFLLHM